MRMRIKKNVVAGLVVSILGVGCANTAKPEIDPRKIAGMEVEYQMAIAKAAYDRNRYEDAIALYKTIIDEDETNMKANANLSAVYLDLGIRGMAYIGQSIDNEGEAEAARVLYEEIDNKSRQFFQLMTPHM